MKIFQEIPNVLKIGKTYQTIYMKTYVSFIVCGKLRLS